MKKIKVFFIIPSLRGGGAERITSILVNNLDLNKFDIKLVLMQKEGFYLKDIRKEVEIIDLKSSRVKKAVFKLFKLIWFNKPDIVFSNAGHLNLLLSILIKILPKKICYIARETAIVSFRHKFNKKGKFYNFLYKRFYKNFDHIIAQSSFMKKDLHINYEINENKIKVINNPVEVNRLHNIILNKKKEFLKKDKINLLAVGGLRKVKRFDILIHSLVYLNDNYRLTIIGEGVEKEKLKALVTKLKLENKVVFLGFVSLPVNYMQEADLLIVTSEHEGFPNVVLEANAVGLPVVALNSPGGIREIIKNNFNGWVINDSKIKTLAQEIDTIVNYKLHKVNRKDIIAYTYKMYDQKNILKKYEKVFLTCKDK